MSQSHDWGSSKGGIHVTFDDEVVFLPREEPKLLLKAERVVKASPAPEVRHMDIPAMVKSFIGDINKGDIKIEYDDAKTKESITLNHKEDEEYEEKGMGEAAASVGRQVLSTLGKFAAGK